MFEERRRYFVFAALALAFVVVFLQRMGMTVIASDLLAELKLDKGQLGLLGSVFLYSYAAVQFFAGILADNYGPRRVVVFFLSFSVVGGLIFVNAQGLESAALGRAMCGGGCGVIISSSFVALNRWFPVHQYTMACGVFFAMGGLGGLLATAPLSALKMAVGWRATYAGITGLGLLALILIWIFVRDYTGPEQEQSLRTGKSALGNIRDNFKDLAKNRNFWLLLMHNASLPGFYYAFIALWAGPYLREVYQLPDLTIGGILTMGAMGFLIGAPLVAWLSEAVFKSHKLALIFFCPVGAIPVILLVFFTDSLNIPALYFLVLCTGFAANAPNAVRYTMTRELLGAHVVGTVGGIYTCVVFGVGGSLQILTGHALDLCKTAGFSIASAYSAAFSIFIACVLLSTAASLLLPETFGREPKVN